MNSNTPRAYFRVDQVFYMDCRYLNLSHTAIVLHLALIGLSCRDNTDGRVTNGHAQLVARQLLFEVGPYWNELLRAGLLIPIDDTEVFQIRKFAEWQMTADKRQASQTNGAQGGKVAAARRANNLPPSGAGPKNQGSTTEDGLDYQEGLREALAIYPKTKYRDKREVQEEAYRSKVNSREDHEMIMTCIRHYADYFAYRINTGQDPPDIIFNWASSFVNFLKTDKYQEYLTSAVPPANGIGTAATNVPGDDEAAYPEGE